MKLINPTDQELNTAFAEKVAGWMKCERLGRMVWYDPEGGHVSSEIELPRFIESADAVLPCLDKVGMWKAERFLPSDICIKGQAYRVDVANRHACDFCHADADTLPRAAVIALLRAYGVEVHLK